MAKAGLDPRIARRLELLLARAGARYEHSAAVPRVPNFIAEYMPMAAASGQINIYGEMAAQNDTLLRVNLTSDTPEIIVKVWSIAFARTNAIRNRSARLITQDGVVDFEFRFDGQGRAEFRLGQTEDIEQALSRQFRIEIYQ